MASAHLTEQSPLVGNRPSARQSVAEVFFGRATVCPHDVDTAETDSRIELDQDDTAGIVNLDRTTIVQTQRASIFDEKIQANLERTNPEAASWLSSMNGVLLQGGIVGVFIAISVYEVVFKKSAVTKASFDKASMVIFQGVFSLAVSLTIAFTTGQANVLFGPHTLKMLGMYAPVGCMFSMTAYLQFVILEYLSSDVFKVLEQSRLLVTALLSFFLFKHGQSRAAWCALVVITLSAVCYGQVAKMEAELAGKSAGKASNNFSMGVTLTALFVIIQCGASVYCELILKKDKHLPFYIQKFYLEVPGTLFACLVSWKIDGWMVSVGLGKAPKYGDVKVFEDGPLAGWNYWVIIAFVFFVMKSWGSGFLVKMMSSLVKQLCSVVAVCLTYFFGLMHLKCPGGEFFCPANLSAMTLSMVVVDMCVLFAVLSYSFAQRDKQRKNMFKEQAKLAKESFNPPEVKQTEVKV
jgi:hypothetical protein